MTAERAYMTAAELRTHHIGSSGRDYSESDDGYSDIEAEESRGWRTLSAWGSDGWDLGQWPYVLIQIRDDGSDMAGGRWKLQSIVEGDRDRYSFDTRDDLYAALDYLFMWYSADEPWSPVTWENRAQLDAGTLRVDPKFHGPYVRVPAQS